jgi:peptide/nickel transport system permease protein
MHAQESVRAIGPDLTMLKYALRRLLLMVPTLFLVMTVVFAVVKLAPGNPFSFARSGAGRAAARMTPSDYEALLRRYGLDKPWYVQYGIWMKNLATGSFGESFGQRRPVVNVFLGRTFRPETGPDGHTPAVEPVIERFLESPLGATLFLNGMALLLVLAMAVPAGLRCAARPGGRFDRLSGGLMYALYALPNFWVAVLLIMLVGVHWKLLPFIGMQSDGYAALPPLGKIADLARHSALPAVCLAFGGLAYIARYTRGAVLDVLARDYIRTARAKGLRERTVLVRHGLRNALVPMLTLAGLLVPALVSGSVIIEPIFAWPGLGQLYLQSIYSRDYPVILAESLLGAVVVLVSMLVVDLAYAWADPRVRVE